MLFVLRGGNLLIEENNLLVNGNGESEIKWRCLDDVCEWLGFGVDWDRYVDALGKEKEKIFLRGKIETKNIKRARRPL